MSTHGVIGVRFPDGRITGCYVHFDGSTIGERLESYLESNTSTGLAVLIITAQATGGMRSFHCPEDWQRDSKSVTDFLDDCDPYVITEKNWDDDHCGARHTYIVDYETQSIQHRCRGG